jgi:hypothetical protein
MTTMQGIMVQGSHLSFEVAGNKVAVAYCVPDRGFFKRKLMMWACGTGRCASRPCGLPG